MANVNAKLDFFCDKPNKIEMAPKKDMLAIKPAPQAENGTNKEKDKWSTRYSTDNKKQHRITKLWKQAAVEAILEC